MITHRQSFRSHRAPIAHGPESPLNGSRRGVTLPEVVVAALALALLAAILTPAILAARERSRGFACQHNLRLIGTALHQYHDVHGMLPPAAVWRGDGLRTIMLKDVKQIDLITYENWAQLLLPHLDHADVASKFDRTKPVMAAVNQTARMTAIRQFACPTDHFNRNDNAFSFQPFEDRDPIAELARGNYAINGGTHNHRSQPETAAMPHFDGVRLIAEVDARRFELIGTGIACVNHSFSISDFRNGQSTLVAVEELRAGIHPLDPRGVWALGQIGGSITWGHGIPGDDCGPNNQWDRADDILGCRRLHDEVGSETLTEERMPCVSYVDQNDQATSRSLHSGGVNVLFVDGTVHFVNDRVDRALWHVMHSRETPAEVLEHGFSNRLGLYRTPADGIPTSSSDAREEPETTVINSLGMKLVVIPAGEFVMGVPDIGNGGDPPPECPAHKVSISRAFLLGQHEVTQSQFHRIMERNPSHHTPEVAGVAETAEFPVENVSWNDAVDFCRRLTAMPEEIAAHRSYRLPTEAEWEYACRSGKSQPYQWHFVRPVGDDSGENSGIEPSLPITRVGSYRANAFDLYDMRGNIWEWTADWFDRSYYSRSPAKDPQGPVDGFIKVVRGGDWTFVGEICRINFPMMSPWKSSPYVGFRVVCELRQGRSRLNRRQVDSEFDATP